MELVWQGSHVDLPCYVLRSAAVQDVAILRASQFSEDAGPMAHPIRPDSYIKMDNFYTVTVYEKVRHMPTYLY